MKELSLDECKELSLNILLTIHAFCERNDIKYSLACGTLIGAIRHGGFIPWDDDIDIYMLREDYNRFLHLFPQNYNNISIAAIELNPNWNRCYAKAYNTKTLVEENSRNNVPEIGLGIDIFPIDDVPDNIFQFKKYNQRRMFLQKIYQIKAVRLSKEKKFYKNCIVFLSHVVTFFLSFRFLAKIMDRYSQKHNNRGYFHVYENCMGLFGKGYFSKNVFNEFIDIRFEGYSLKSMSGYDEYLTAFYGNYMQLPPKEKRVSHHSFKAYLK